jgi:hypothetical protein
MKNNLFTVLTIFTIGFFTNNISAQGATITATTAGAEIASPITLKQDSVLEFGAMIVSATDGTCVLDPEDTGRTATGGVTLITSGATPNAAGYTVGGTASRNYAITLPTTITVKNGVNDMTINSINSYVTSKTAFSTTGTLASNAQDTFKVGGTLYVDASQAAGVYAGTFQVTVNYN